MFSTTRTERPEAITALGCVVLPVDEWTPTNAYSFGMKHQPNRPGSQEASEHRS